MSHEEYSVQLTRNDDMMVIHGKLRAASISLTMAHINGQATAL